jgi:predicted TIM-barrel fold metal-dependent hydrolase
LTGERPSGPSFFDCNVTIGATATPVLGNVLDVEALVRELDLLSIDEALVVHAHAQELDYRLGNGLVADAVGRAPRRLWPMATMFPTPTGRRASNPGVKYLNELLASGIRAVRLHPNPTHHIMDPAVYAPQYPLVEEVAGPLLEAMQVHRVPLFVELAQVTWPEIYGVCRNFPALPVVLLNVSYTHKRSLYGGFDAYPNLYAECSCFHAYRGVEEICEVFGPHRLLFGTRLPTYDAVAAIGMVMYSDIDPDARAAIAGGNLRRLLDGVLSPAAPERKGPN